MSKPKINISIESTKMGFVFCDNTGSFSGDNPNGWKPGTWSINNVTSASIKITLPYGGGEITKVVSPGLPSLNCTCIEILASDLGLTKIESGEYKFEYFITITSPTGPTIIKTTKRFFHLHDVMCCIEGKKKKLTNDCEKDKCVYLMDLMFESMTLAICKGDTVSAQEILDYLRYKCNCKCC
jgi:hypothetical protein